MFQTLDPYGHTQFGSVFFSHGDAQEVATKWQQRLGAATEAMTAGAHRVQVAPGQAAVAQKQAWINAMADPTVQAKWANNTGRVTLANWLSAYLAGIPRVAQGASQKLGKYEAALVPLLAYIDSGLPRIKSMDKSTFEARLARSAAWQRYMHSYQRPANS